MCLGTSFIWTSKVACKQSNISIHFRNDDGISANPLVVSSQDNLNSNNKVRGHVSVIDKLTCRAIMMLYCRAFNQITLCCQWTQMLRRRLRVNSTPPCLSIESLRTLTQHRQCGIFSLIILEMWRKRNRSVNVLKKYDWIFVQI